MKKPLLLLFALMLVFQGNVSAESTVLKPGHWSGPIQTPMGELTIVFNIESEDGKTFTATCDSPDQGATGIPVESVTLKDKTVTIIIPSVSGKFTGTLDETGSTISGKWSQSGMDMDCTVTCSDTPFTKNRPQNPVEPFPYTVQDITVVNSSALVTLAGTLTLPPGDGPFPGVILVHGSGPNDRDETVFGHRPFLVLADHLTRNGIAVLRYDKRGIGGSTGDHVTATTEDFASDALAALLYLKKHKRVDSAKCGLIGHSEGGLIVPQLAAHHPDTIAFIISLAGPGVTGREVMSEQLQEYHRILGKDKEFIARELTNQQALFDIVLQESDNEKAAKLLDAHIEKLWDTMSDPEKQQSGYSLKDLKLGATTINSPWFRYFLTYDPRIDLAKVTCPVLAVWGEKDTQVLPEQNRPEVEKALAAARNKNVTIKVFPDLNHLFQTCELGLVTEYGSIEETIAPVFLEYLTRWIHQLK